MLIFSVQVVTVILLLILGCVSEYNDVYHAMEIGIFDCASLHTSQAKYNSFRSEYESYLSK